MKPNRKSYHFFVRFPFFVVILLLIGMGIFSRRGWKDWRRMVNQNSELLAQIDISRVQKEALERQIEAFSTDRNEQERVIRQSLGFVRGNETVIEFE